MESRPFAGRRTMVRASVSARRLRCVSRQGNWYASYGRHCLQHPGSSSDLHLPCAERLRASCSAPRLSVFSAVFCTLPERERGKSGMSNTNQHVRERQRLDFAKIQGSIQIPNLIEVQKKSYQRFLQMDLLPSERDDGGLQSVFTSVFPIRDFREMSQLEFVDYSIGNWECKCGNLKGLHNLRATCRNAGASLVTNRYRAADVLCQKRGTFTKNTPTFS